MVDFEGLASTPNEPSLQTEFQALAPPPRGTSGPAELGIPVTTASSSIATFGALAVIADADSGSVILATQDGEVVARLPVDGATQLAVDRARGRAYVTNRRGDEVVVLGVNEAGRSLTRLGAWSTPREPHSAALTPDGKFLLVTTIADRTLVALDTSTGRETWRTELIPEARGLAISPDGSEATVTFLSASSVAKVDLRSEQRGARYIAIGRPHSAATAQVIENAQQNVAPFGTSMRRKRRVARPRVASGPVPTFARGAFATTYMKNMVAVVPYHRATPIQNTGQISESRGTYGGGGITQPPIVHRIAMIGPDGDTSRAHLDVRVPRAVAYDAKRDFLFVAGKGDDKISLIAEASEPTAHFANKLILRQPIAVPQRTTTKPQKVLNPAQLKGPTLPPTRQLLISERCGPSGLAVTDGGELLVHCGLSHRVVRVKLDGSDSMVAKYGDDLGGSRLSVYAKKGRELFFRAQDARMTGLGAFACANCHPDARADGLSWRIEGNTLQTPFLSGRLIGTHPFKWDGQDADLTQSLSMTVRRLGGTGLDQKEVAQLRAFLESLDPPRAPTVRDPAAAKRGADLFASEGVGCSSCHSGARFTDGHSYELTEDLQKVDTPSLIGIAHSAPYYHDGSAATLEAVLLENGSVHGMGKVANLTNAQRADLIAYLETL